MRPGRSTATTVGFASPTLHASYLHTHWAGHPHLAQRFADAVHAAVPHAGSVPTVPEVRTLPAPLADPLRHHGDAEAEEGLLDLAVNVHAGPRPSWLDDALRASLAEIGRYPASTAAERAIAARHGRDATEVLATAGAAEAFTLLARLRAWRAPVVVHPQFTEPHAALDAGRPPRRRGALPGGGRVRPARRGRPRTAPTSSCSATRPTRPACSTRP